MDTRNIDKIDFNKNLHICSTCGGRGFVQNEKCPNCFGIGMALLFHGRFLYWGKKIDTINILVDRAIIVINKIINIALILFGMLGFVVLGYFAYLDGFRSIVSYEYWLTPTFEKLIFWLSLFADMYLYYRLIMEREPRRCVLNRIFVKPLAPPDNLDWSFIRRLPRARLINIAEAFNLESINFIERSWQLARDFGHSTLDRIHLLASLPQFDTGALVLGRLGIDYNIFKNKVSHVLSWNISSKSLVTDFSPEVFKVLLSAYLEAYEEGNKKVGLIDVVKSLTRVEVFTETELATDYIDKILIDLELSYQKVINVVEWIRIQNRLRESFSRFQSRARYKPRGGMDRAMTAIATPYLDQFSTDLTAAARNNAVFPCIGRTKEFEQIMRIFEGSRNGVLLIGNYGVGKSTVITGLAERMVEEIVPEALQDKRLVSISVPRLISGADAATVEERLLVITNEIIQSQNIVVVIEDVHGLIGITSGSEASMDLSEVLAEILSKRLFYVIATTNPDDYSRSLARSSLGGMFEPVRIEELEFNDAIQVCEAKSGPIEYKNSVYFSYDSIEKAVDLSGKFIHDKYLPDKALNIMEEAAVKVRQEKGVQSVVSGEDVAVIVSAKTGIKATRVTEDESSKLLNLEAELHKRLIGQDEAVKIVSAGLRRARAELRDTKRPISSLLFLGPTGVGKTELAKAIAEVYFGDEERMLRFDMSEFQEQSSIDRLLGNASAPGVLTEQVRQKPYSIVLLDEVEKAHPDILNLFLQVMDDGRLTDGQGRTVDFTSSIIIMTSNAGAQIIQNEIVKGTSVEALRELLVNDELHKHFRPELLNRYDGIIVFKPLTMTEVIQIARLMADKIIKRMAEKNIKLQISDAAIAELAEFGFDPKFGARPLRRVMQERVDDTLANYLLRGTVSRRDTILLGPGGELTVAKGEEI